MGHVNRPFDSAAFGGFVPTKIFPVRSKVDAINALEFSKIDSPPISYAYKLNSRCMVYMDTGLPLPIGEIIKCNKMSVDDINMEVDRIFDNNNILRTIELKVGANVMCIANLDIDNGICNGSQGVITHFIPSASSLEIPVVKFTNGVTMPIIPFSIQSEEFPMIVVTQVPLRLAWAITIHKSQGVSLAMAEIDVGKSIFESGQTYVALSRVKSLDGLYLSSFLPNKIRVNPDVISFYKKIPQLELDVVIETPPPPPPSSDESKTKSESESESTDLKDIKIINTNNRFSKYSCI